jgi:hypothetical protein
VREGISIGRCEETLQAGRFLSYSIGREISSVRQGIDLVPKLRLLNLVPKLQLGNAR